MSCKEFLFFFIYLWSVNFNPESKFENMQIDKGKKKNKHDESLLHLHSCYPVW